MGEFILECLGQFISKILFESFLRLLKGIGIIFLQLVELVLSIFNEKSFDQITKDKENKYKEDALPYWIGLIIIVAVLFLIFF